MRQGHIKDAIQLPSVSFVITPQAVVPRPVSTPFHRQAPAREPQLDGIDPVGRRDLLVLFRELAAQGKQLLISSHELEELEKITNHVAIMTRGRLAAVGTLDDIRHQLDDRPHTVRIDSTASMELAKHLLDLPGVLGLERNDSGVIVRVAALKSFSEAFGKSVADHGWAVTRFEPLDDSAHSILGYVLGGSGKT